MMETNFTLTLHQFGPLLIMLKATSIFFINLESYTAIVIALGAFFVHEFRFLGGNN